MAVAIQVLSGARQGDRWEFDTPEFRAGDAPSCEIFFDPLRDLPAQGRLLLFQLGDEGWTLRNLGSPGVIVNEQVVAGQAHLRSGDVVRLSPGGPDLSFQLISHLSAQTAPHPVLPPSPTALPPASPLAAPWPAPTPVAAPIYAPTVVRPPPSAAAPQPTKTSAARLADATSNAANRGIAAGRASLLVAALALGVAMVVFVRQFSGDQPPRQTAVAPKPRPNEKEERAGSDTQLPGAAPNDPSQSRPDEPPGEKRDIPVVTQNTTRPPPLQDPKLALDEARQALWLVAVEEPKAHTAWPIAVAAAVRPRAALTSATVIVELKRFQSQGWKIILQRPGEARKVAVADLRLHIGFANAPGDPETQIYDDFGLLSTDDELDRLIIVADDGERAGIEQGMPLTCLTIAFEWEPVTKYQTYTPEIEKGKVFAITLLEPDRRGSPRLLHATLKAPAKAYGSPVLNPAGHLIGIYAETVPQADTGAASGPALQYVPVFDGRWLDSDFAASWLEPTLNEPKNPSNPEP